MNVVTAAKECKKFLVYLPIEDDSWCGRKHVAEMLDKLIDGSITGEKAHRWLGWAQCCFYMFGGIDAQTLKDINRKA